MTEISAHWYPQVAMCGIPVMVEVALAAFLTYSPLTQLIIMSSVWTELTKASGKTFGFHKWVSCDSLVCGLDRHDLLV